MKNPRAGPPAGVASLSFLDEAIERLLEAWPPGSFVGPEAAQEELESIAEHVRASLAHPDTPPYRPRDRLLTRRLSEVLSGQLVETWADGEVRCEAAAFMDVLARLRRLTRESLPEEGEVFAARLVDPDGFELVFELAHDLRSPLTSISFLAETLRSGHSGPLSEHQRYQLGLIYSAATGLSAIVSDIVDLAQAEGDPLEGEPRPFSVENIVSSVCGLVRPLAEAKGIELRVDLDCHDRVRGYPLAINRILANLLINAIKFTEEGWVGVTVRTVDTNLLEFSVRDTGRGIDDENQRNLFKPFRASSNREGSFFSSSGLGLSIVRRLVHALGSDLELETRPDWGTRFSFEVECPPVREL